MSKGSIKGVPSISNNLSESDALKALSSAKGNELKQLIDAILLPQENPDPVKITAWEEFSMAVDATTTAPTISPAATVNKAYWRRVGDTLHVRYTYSHTGLNGQTSGSGTYLFMLPNGLTVDLSKVSYSDPTVSTQYRGVVGHGVFARGGDESIAKVFVADSGDAVYLQYVSDSTDPQLMALIESGVGYDTTTGLWEISIEYEVPISGWETVNTTEATRAAAISDWQPYVMEIGATTTAPTKATNPDIDIAQWRRVGDSMGITYSLKQSNTTGAAAGTGTYLFPVPSGYVIDLTKIASGTDSARPLGVVGSGGVANTAAQRDALIRVYDSNHLIITYDNNSGFADVGSSAFEINNSNTSLYWSFEAVVPIVGWTNDIEIATKKPRNEYASNIDIANADDLTSFSNAEGGSVIPLVSGSAKRKRVRFPTPAFSHHKIELQISENGGSTWLPSSETRFGNKYVSTNKYGMLFAPVPGISTDYDIWFLENGVLSSDGATSTTWSTENGNSILWRLVKTESATPISLQQEVAGISDWRLFNMVIDSTGTTPTKADDPVFDLALWRRVGDSMDITWAYQHTSTTGASNGTGTFLFRLPEGYTIDTNKLISNPGINRGYGTKVGNVHEESGTDALAGSVYVYDEKSLLLEFQSTTNYFFADGSSLGWSSGAVLISFNATIPIAQWSSNIELLNNANKEYLYNLTTTNADDTTSFARGKEGGVVPSVSSVSKTKRVRSPYDLTNATIIPQIREGNSGPWIDIPGSEWDYMTDGSTFFLGIGYKRVAGSGTDLDVIFGADGVYIHGTGLSTWGDENLKGTRFRLKIIYNESRLEAPSVTSLTNSQIVTVYDKKTSGTNGGTFTSGAWQTRDLNTLDDPLSSGFASLSSNQVTLQAGTYEIEWSAPAYLVDRHQSRFYNITDAQTMKAGSSEYIDSTDGNSTSSSYGSHIFTITGPKIFEIQHWCQKTEATVGFGTASGSGEDEIYTQIKIRKIGETV